MPEPGDTEPPALSRYDALLRTSKGLAAHRTMGELLHGLSEQLHSVVPFDYLALVLCEETDHDMRLVVVEPADVGLPFLSMPITAQGPAATVWETQQAAIIAIPDEGTLHPTLATIRSLGRKMTCWLPLTTAHGRVGVLSFGSRSPTAYSDDALAFMEQVAAIVAIAVDNGLNHEHAQQYQRELRNERDRLRFVLDVNNLLVSHLDHRGLLEAICEAVQRVIEADHISVALYDQEFSVLRLDWIYDRARGFSRSDATLPLDRSIGGLTIQRGAAAVFRRSELDDRDWQSAPLMKASGAESVCCVPLATRNGTVGVLYVGSVKADAFPDDHVALLGAASVQIAIALENARAYQEIARANSQLIDAKEYLERELQNEFAEIIGSSAALRRVLAAVETVAPTDTTVLLLGETGTGKELIARAVHTLSPRRERTFVRMNVAALAPGVLESELFGHERGAFTGAVANRAGRVELANRGTLFLDEVGDMPLDVQPKFLRVLQEREFERVGSARTQPVDVRVVAATNRDLERMVDEGSFRSDLFYRLNVFPITIPPLRERIDDIPALARHFAAHCCRRVGRPVLSIPERAIDALKQWSWPGNIRELQNVIERAVVLSPGPELVLPLRDIQPKAGRMGRTASSPKPATTFHDAEREAIISALRDSGGVVAGPEGAAHRLGLRRTTLQSKMRRLGIQRPSY